MIKEELLGKTLTVTEAKNESLIGITGTVVDETKNTLVIRTDNDRKTLLKEQVTIQVDNTIMDGSLITQRPEKRTKNKQKQWQRKQPTQ